MSTATDIEPWKFQANFKFGQHMEGLLNVRANAAKELDENSRAMYDVAGTLVGLQEMLRAESVVHQSFSGTTRVDTQANTPATGPAPTANTAPADAAPTCGPNGSHGYMVRRESKPGEKDQWWGWFCPLDKAAPGRCKPVYPGRN